MIYESGVEVGVVFNLAHRLQTFHQQQQNVDGFRSTAQLSVTRERRRQKSLVDLRFEAHDVNFFPA